MFFFFKQKTAYEMRISDWSSDVCSSDLLAVARAPLKAEGFFQALCRAAVAAGNAAVGIVDHAPGAETVAVAVGAQHPEPVDQDADALLEHVGVEARDRKSTRLNSSH